MVFALTTIGLLPLVTERLSVPQKEVLCLRLGFDSDEFIIRPCRPGFSCATLCKCLCKESSGLPRVEVLALQSGQVVDFAPEGC
jgi:hypothetical protein